MEDHNIDGYDQIAQALKIYHMTLDTGPNKRLAARNVFDASLDAVSQYPDAAVQAMCSVLNSFEASPELNVRTAQLKKALKNRPLDREIANYAAETLVRYGKGLSIVRRPTKEEILQLELVLEDLFNGIMGTDDPAIKEALTLGEKPADPALTKHRPPYIRLAVNNVSPNL